MLGSTSSRVAGEGLTALIVTNVLCTVSTCLAIFLAVVLADKSDKSDKSVPHPGRAAVRFHIDDIPANIVFEPLGQEFPMKPTEDLVLDVPVEDLRELVLVTFDGGLSVWLPYPGDHIVRDTAGAEIARL